MRLSLQIVLITLLPVGGALARPATALAQPAVQMCSGQPVPAGYVIVATSSRINCPSEFGASYNTFTIRMPGDTITVCSELSRLSDGYVITEYGTRLECPSGFGSASNTTTYQRVGPPAQPEVPSEGTPAAAFTMLDPYDRTVFQRLDEMKASLGLQTPTHHLWLSKTADGTTARASLQLEGGLRYTLVAVCDGDCTDLNLRVLDGG
ncbi:MAG TPA: hypothetical protein VGC13_12730 [Longimicrobium sp.]|jgi:hypothetical protein|uniref:hypothetical protein n=1 Tax=Longimicrobium sp. TaxID=2029185 RepID=UPI002ED99DCF